MSKNRPTTESKKLEQARIALTNAETHEEIKQALADYGMDSPKIAEGKSVYENTRAIWELNEKETAESRIASSNYKVAYEEVEGLFKRHRDHTLLYFKKNPEVLVMLGVKGRFPGTYTEFFDKVNQFYGGIKSNPDIQNEMNKIKITANIVEDCLQKHEALLSERAVYDKEEGESQATTKTKKAAFAELEDWMDDFEAIARIALYDKAQLLEVLGYFVRS